MCQCTRAEGKTKAEGRLGSLKETDSGSSNNALLPSVEMDMSWESSKHMDIVYLLLFGSAILGPAMKTGVGSRKLSNASLLYKSIMGIKSHPD